MYDQKLNIGCLIDGLDEVYRRTCSLADALNDEDESKKETDLRLALMFIKYAGTYNMGGKFDQVYDEKTLAAACERYLLYAGNAAYFDYMLTSYRNNLALLHMLRDALCLLEKCGKEITFRKQDGAFIEKMHDGHAAKIEKLETEITAVSKALDAKQAELSKVGFILKYTVQKNDYIRLEKEAKELQAQKDKLSAELAALEDAYRQYYADYYTYMENLSVEDDDKISRYFFCERDEEFERVYGLTNVFEADSGWLKDKIEAVAGMISADDTTYRQRLKMLEEAQRYAQS